MSGGQAAAFGTSSGAPTPWGWHRLADDWAGRVVEAAGVRAGEVVVDIGAGNGALTTWLLAADARVIALELHRRRADRLRRRLAGEERLSVLTLDVRDFRWPGRPVRVVANPPFALLGDLVATLVRQRWLTGADLVVPRAVVRRYESRGRTGRWLFRAGIKLPRSAFSPRPPLDCGVLQLRRR